MAIFLKRDDELSAKYLGIVGDLNVAFMRDVDVVLLNRADYIVTMQVLVNGELIINNDAELFHQFKAVKISQYIDFKISRRVIEENLLEGRIYA